MSLGKDEIYLTAEALNEALSAVSSTRWPIAVSLVDDELTATELAKVVGKSVSWTLKQAKQMEAAGILNSAPDPLNQTRGRVYKLAGAVDREVLKRLDQYEAAARSLERGAQASPNTAAAPSLTERAAQAIEVMALGADATAISYGFIPVSVVQIGTGDEAQYQQVNLDKPMMVADAFEKFAEIVRQIRQLDSLGESAQPLRTQPQANPSE